MSTPVSRTKQVGARPGRWRDLRLPVKLAMVSLVPMVVMLTLGVVLIHGQLANAGQYARANRITQLSASVRAVVTGLQDERSAVAGGAVVPATDARSKSMPGMPPGKAAATGTVAPNGPAAVRHRVDLAAAAARQAIDADSAAGDLDPVAGAAWSAADHQLGELPRLRKASAAPKPNRSTEAAGYSGLIDAMFAFDRVLTTDLADARLTRQALSIYDLFAAREEVRYEQAVVLAGIGNRTLSVSDVTALHGSEARLDSRISDFRAVASQDVARQYAISVDPAAMSRQNELLGQAIDQSGGMTGQVMPGMAIGIPTGTWNTANSAVTAGLDQITGRLATSLQADAAAQRSGASGAAATAIVVLVIALAATIALVVLIARQLVLSIAVLRRSARDVASRRLPDAVERIRAGETVAATVEPVGVHTGDEVGQLARAFDAVHGEALRLAVEQATMRANYSELFVNLSRRSQSLVQRQLRLIEQLERDEEDPEQLAALFKLDHLATRMRRNNENLMVLSGGELARSNGQQVTLADLLRAAVSEIEHYERIVVQPPPDTQVVGYAAGDLVRLLAELLDNATAFSAPDTPVTVASHRTRRKAVVIDIVDHGIGMADDELARANEQLSHPAGVEGRISRRMGLFVISRLADQHGVRVRLHGGQDIPGLRVTITVPAELVIGEAEPLPPAPGGTDTPPGGGFGGPLPKRTAGATSGPHGPWQATLSGTLDTRPAIGDPLTGAMTVTIPKLPSATSSGVGLFAPLSDEDEQGDVAVTEQDGGGEAVAPEVTPIFDTLSAWFADTTPAGDVDDDTEGGPSTPGWEFAADEGWQAVGAVVDVEPAEFTVSGLPKRQPKALLLPGSVRLDESAERPADVPAERLRHRLSGFQDGVRRARHAAPAEDDPATTVFAPDTEQTVRAAPVSPPPTTEQAADRWASQADDGWRAAEAMTGQDDPGEYTLAGLPRRTPKEHLLPGSVAPERRPPAPDLDAGVLRERLTSFQRGVRDARGGQPAEPAPAEHGFHW
ncbi:MAG TPA: nitrate- and nitrite sensing domain-containing protein [Pseudonocardiaceae bacterium]|nr:nitrate- and nitrite sensing domain-containing protein [Pseudonocardiaceae bacterium]